MEALADVLEEAQLLTVRVADGNDHAAALGELSRERRGNSRSRSADKNGIKRSELGQAESAVAAVNMNVGVPEASEALGSGVSERGAALDGVHVGGEEGKDRSLVAAADADLKDAFRAGQLERGSHGGDDVGLRNRLAFTDRQRGIFVGAGAVHVRHEFVAQHTFHGRKHAGIGDAAAANLFLDHFAAQLGVRVVGRLRRRLSPAGVWLAAARCGSGHDARGEAGGFFADGGHADVVDDVEPWLACVESGDVRRTVQEAVGIFATIDGSWFKGERPAMREPAGERGAEARAEIFTYVKIGHAGPAAKPFEDAADRSEERRVGKECRSRWSPYH